MSLRLCSVCVYVQYLVPLPVAGGTPLRQTLSPATGGGLDLIDSFFAEAPAAPPTSDTALDDAFDLLSVNGPSGGKYFSNEYVSAPEYVERLALPVVANARAKIAPGRYDEQCKR